MTTIFTVTAYICPDFALFNAPLMHILIIGNGISGITAARYIRKLSDHRISVISSETEHFFSRTALMYIYMGHMTYENTKPYEDWFWKKNRIDLVHDHVQAVDTQSKQIQLKSGKNLTYDKLIIAVGSKPNKFGWKGQDLAGVQGLYAMQDLELMHRNTSNARHGVIVGGGLIGIEVAEMLASRRIGVTFLVRESSFWNGVLPPEESEMINRHIREHHIDLRLGTELKEVLPDSEGRTAAVITNKGKKIDCQFVALTAGVHPNVDFLRNHPSIETAKGVLVNEYLQTSAPDVYAIGDCAEHRQPSAGRRPIEAVWYAGQMTGKCVAANICGKPQKYVPRLWFNSAKFFDIEYQIYGTVLAKPPQNHAQLYWEHPNGKKSIRIVYNKNDGAVLGFNLMGIRYRHQVCEAWILDKTPIKTVLENLKTANFDPEFYDKHEKEVNAAFEQMVNG